MNDQATSCNQKKLGRHSIRLTDYDYSENGAYFVTICTQSKVVYFNKFPELKNLVQSEWDLLSDRFPSMISDTFVVMPNHVHAVIVLRDVGANLAVSGTRGKNVGATLAVAQNTKPTIGQIIGAYKSLCTTKWLKYIKQNGITTLGSFWQRGYFERVIRNEYELNLVREYIIFNPIQWSFDSDNPDHIYDREYSNKWQWLEGEK